MLITFQCTNCNARLRIDSEAIGTELDCPECDAVIQVPKIPFGPGYVVGGFLIKEKIGQGGMGEVYLATQLSMERNVALKILPPQFTRQGNFVVRFLKEVHFQAKLEHPNIVTAYEAGEDSGVYYMAMAYVKGETLEDLLEREGSLSEQDALRITEQVAEALRYAWDEHGLLHRDIKPGNIMVSAGTKAKILDLGLSKSIHDTRAITHADTLMGTPNYMSPEQIDRPQDVDFRGDMYALGMTLYHMLTGVIPFADTSYLKTLKRQEIEQLRDPRTLMPGINEATTRLLEWTLARHEDERPASWNDFLAALRAARSQKILTLHRVPEHSTLDRDSANDPPQPEVTHKRLIVSGRMLIGGGIGSCLLLVILGFLLLPRNPGTEAHLQETSELVETRLPQTTKAAVVALPAPEPTRNTETLALRGELADLLLEYDRSPSSYDHVLDRLQDLGTRVKSTPLSTEVMEQIRKLRSDHKVAMEEEYANLTQELERLLSSEGPEAARAYLKNSSFLYPDHAGTPWLNLEAIVSDFETQEVEAQQARLDLAEQALADLENDLAPLLLQSNTKDALFLIEQAADQPEFADVTQEQLDILSGKIEHLRMIPNEVLESFTDQIGEEIEIRLREGVRSLRVLDVNEKEINVQRLLRSDSGTILGSTEYVITFKDLHRAEVLRRLQTHQSHAATLYKGIMAQQNGSQDMAIHYFRLAGAPFGPQMASQLELLRVPLDLPTIDLLPELKVGTDTNELDFFFP